MSERRDQSLAPSLKLAALAGRMLPGRAVAAIYRLGPVSRLLRSLLTRAAPSGAVEVEIAGGPLAGLRMLLDLQSEKDLWLGAYEADTLAAIVAFGRPGMVAYDIGAHLGYVSMALAKVGGPGGRVVAFEPLPENLARLRTNLELNGLLSVVAVEPRAVGAKTGTASFLVHRSPGMGKLEGSGGRGTAYGAPVSVEVVALDDHVFALGGAKPDLIKIDVEGGEADALLGMRRVLGEIRPMLLMELHGEEAAQRCWDVLRRASYAVRRMRPGWPPVNSPDELDWKAHVVAAPEGQSISAAGSRSGREA